MHPEAIKWNQAEEMDWLSECPLGSGNLPVEATKAVPKSSAGGAAASSPKAKPAAVPRSSANTGILKVVPVSLAMQKFLGVPEISRTDAVKRIWNYIKTNSLQNPENKKEIMCSEKLKIIFDGKDKVGFMEVSKLMSRHFVKPE